MKTMSNVKSRLLKLLMTLATLGPAPGRADDCDGWLGGDRAKKNIDEITRQQVALRTLKFALPVAFPHVQMDEADFYNMLSRLLIPGDAQPSDLVTLVFTGAARMGKSTLVNSLRALVNHRASFDPADELTPAGRRGGTTRRPLIVIPRGQGEMFERRLAELNARFPDMQMMTSPQELLEDGPPLYTVVDGFEQFPNLVIVDTPDLTTGDRREHATPRNAKAARAALLTADVVLVAMDDDNIVDLGVSNLIAGNFKSHGYRNSAFFLRTSARPGLEIEESRGWLTEASRSFYDLPKGGDAPEGVMAMFAVEKNPEVNRTINPKVTPLGAFPELTDFLRQVSRESAKVRGYAARAAAKTAYAAIGGEITKSDRARAAKEIYRDAVAALAQMAPPPIAFPYEDGAKEFRGKLNEQGGRVNQAADDAARLAASAGRKLSERHRGAKKSPSAAPNFSDIVRSTDQAIRERWVGYMDGVLRELQQGRVTLPSKVAVDLGARIATFNRSYGAEPATVAPPDEASAPAVDPPKTITIQLPEFAFLPAESQAEMQKLFGALKASLIAHFTTSADENATVALTEERVNQAVATIRQTDYKSHSKSRDLVANLVTNVAGFGGPFGALVKLGSVLAPGALAGGGAAAGIVAGTVAWPVVAGAAATIGIGFSAATFLRLYLEGQIDADLKPLLEAWFNTLQADSFKRGFKDGVMRSALENLSSDVQTEQTLAVEAVRNALRVLGAGQGEAKP